MKCRVPRKLDSVATLLICYTLDCMQVFESNLHFLLRKDMTSVLLALDTNFFLGQAGPIFQMSQHLNKAYIIFNRVR